MDETQIRELAAAIIWNAVHELPNAEPEIGGDFDDMMVRAVYIGDALNIMPSGKFYTPWANSNVALCESCDGEGRTQGHLCPDCGGVGSREAYLDELMGEALDEEAEKFDCVVGSSEGCSTDLYLYQFTRIEEDEDEPSYDDSVSHGKLAV